ncbi:hypothetical protein [Kiloniella antarctica]|uniref:Uncharacterized protein n=1 Tax=Kiloniella antarctica TaxID=1550907 RepID=A0ABW5BJ56_9PROT
MTISATPRRASYSGDGSTAVFAVPFKFLADSHLKVVVTSLAGIENVVVPSAVSGAGTANGGAITFSTAPLVGEIITILGATPLEQQTDLAISDGMPADVIETAVDLLTIQNQEQADQIGLAIKLPVSYSGDELQFPAPVPNEVPYYDADGKLVTSSVGFSTLLNTVQGLITLAADTGQAHTHPFSGLTGTEKVLLSDISKALSAGFTTEVNSYGNTTDNPIIDLTKTFLTSMTNNGAGVITADKVNNNSVDIWMTNGPTAGVLDISSFDYIKGTFGVGDGVITIMHMSTVNGVARVALEVLE